MYGTAPCKGNSGRSNVRLTLRICAHLIGYAQGEKGVFGNTDRRRGSVLWRD
ncbi:MAG: hypothetical protein ACK56F_18040 [bacterium]